MISMMNRHRPNFATRGLNSGTPEEKAAAFDTYLSYGGTYKVKENKLIHIIEFSSFPNWTGTTRERTFKIENDKLTLVAVRNLQSADYLTWEKLRTVNFL